MTDQPHFTRSPELMSADDTVLAVIDVQQKLISLIPDHERIVWNIRRLLDGAKHLGVAVLATEQYPQGLGGTVAELASRLPGVIDKTAFSSCGSQQFCQRLAEINVPKVLLAGIEAHVCVQQTALDLVAHETALRRMELGGVTLTTTESALFEWCRQSGTPQFKQISSLVRETPPPSK
jgi:nicotinamidase-related amidase